MQVFFTQTALIFYGIAIASMLLHAIKKWIAGEIEGNLIDWYVVHPKMSTSALLACLGGIATAIGTGVLTDASATAQILAAWGIGYGADTVNSQGDTK